MDIFKKFFNEKLPGVNFLVLYKMDVLVKKIIYVLLMFGIGLK